MSVCSSLSISVCCPGMQCVGRETNILFVVAMTHKLTEAGKWASETSPSSFYGFFNPSLFNLCSCWLSTGLTHTLILSLKHVSSVPVCAEVYLNRTDYSSPMNLHHSTSNQYVSASLSSSLSLGLFLMHLFNDVVQSPILPTITILCHHLRLASCNFHYHCKLHHYDTPHMGTDRSMRTNLRLNSVNTQVSEWRGDWEMS